MLQEMIRQTPVFPRTLGARVSLPVVYIISILCLVSGCNLMTGGAEDLVIYRQCSDAIDRIDGKMIWPPTAFSASLPGPYFIESFDCLDELHLMTIGLCPDEPDSHGGRIIVWDLARKESRKEISPDSVHVYDMAINPSGTMLAAVQGPLYMEAQQSLVLYDLSSGEPTVLSTGYFKDLCWDVSGRSLYFIRAENCHKIAREGKPGMVVKMLIPRSPLGTIQEATIAPGYAVTTSNVSPSIVYMNEAGEIIKLDKEGNQAMLPIPAKYRDRTFFTTIRFVRNSDTLILTKFKFWGDEAFLFRPPYTKGENVLGGSCYGKVIGFAAK